MKKIALVSSCSDALQLIKNRETMVSRRASEAEVKTVDLAIEGAFSACGIFSPKKEVRYNHLLAKTPKNDSEHAELTELMNERKACLEKNVFAETINAFKMPGKRVKVKSIQRLISKYNTVTTLSVPEALYELVYGVSSLNPLNIPVSLVYSQVEKDNNEINKDIEVLKHTFISCIYDETMRVYKKFLWCVTYEVTETAEESNADSGSFDDSAFNMI